MKTVEITEQYDAVVTQMREGAAFGASNEELHDGNMIANKCQFAGELACEKACQFKELKKSEPEAGSEEAEKIENVGLLCAEENILTTLRERHIHPENFVLASATKDRVIFADEIDESGATRHPDGYTVVPQANGFYFRPGVDMTVNKHRQINMATMRMADCGDVVVSGKGRRRGSFSDNEFLGQGHFSRTNMRGPSAYIHEMDGQKVSWGEYFIGNGVEHYTAEVSELKVKLVAAVDDNDFLHYYADDAARDAYFPGWNELGFMHYTGNVNEQGRKECLINYRDMIVWQLTDGIQNPKYRLSRDQISFEDAINTGDISLGHASHHKATHGDIAQGRDMYMVGFNQREAIASRIAELQGQNYGNRRMIAMSSQFVPEQDKDAFRRMIEVNDAELAQLAAELSKYESEDK